MRDKRQSKNLFYGDFALGKCYRPKKGFEDVVRERENTVNDRKEADNSSDWRKLFFDDCKHFEVNRVDHSKLKRALRKYEVDSIPKDIQFELVWLFYLLLYLLVT